jgi:hypothetical protein
MQIYWTLNQVPELAGASRQERGRRWRAAYRSSRRRWQVWLGRLVCGLCAGGGVAIGSAVSTPFLGGLVGACVGGGIGGFILSQVAIAVARRYQASTLRGAQ